MWIDALPSDGANSRHIVQVYRRMADPPIVTVVAYSLLFSIALPQAKSGAGGIGNDREERP